MAGWVGVLGVPGDLLRNGDGRFWRGNLHCHSNRSDGHSAPERVVAAYRDAGYDFLALSDHFEERYGGPSPTPAACARGASPP